jgi:hypothetical protein
MASHSYCPMASHSYCPMASHSYCPNGNSKYANDNIYQLTSWPSQYLVPTMGSCHTNRGIQLCDQRARRKLRFVGSSAFVLVSSGSST